MKIFGNKYEDMEALELFDSAIKFDKKEALKSIKKSSKLYLSAKDVQKRLLKGYSKISKIPDNKLENRFRDLLTSKQGHFLPKLFVETFFLSSLLRFDVIYSSNFTSVIEERISKATFFTSIQLGWPINIIKTIVTQASDLIKFVDDKIITNSENVFEQNLTKNPVSAWRANFPFRPISIFSALNSVRRGKVSKKWRLIQEDSENINVDLMLNHILQLIDKEKDDLETLSRAIGNLILLGVDLNKNELVSSAIETFEEKFSKVSFEGGSYFELVTALALGYAFLGNLNYAINALVNHISMVDDQFYGFVGSLYLKKKNPDIALNFFASVFKLRHTPLSWPIKVISEYDLDFKTKVLEIIKDDDIPLFLEHDVGRQINKIIDSNFPECQNWEDYIKSLYDSKDSVMIKEKEDIIDHEELTESIGEENNDLIQKDKIIKELQELLSYYDNIIIAEKDMNKAQNDRDWQFVHKLASKLDELWNNSRIEIVNICRYLAIPEDSKESVLAKRIVDGEKKPSLIVNLIADVNNIYELNIIKLNAEKKEFIDRLSKTDLYHLLPDGDLSEKDFIRYRESLMPKVVRYERIQEVGKGLVKPSEIVKEFPDEIERKSTIREILFKIDQGLLDQPNNLSGIISTVTWDSTEELNVLDLFVSGLRNEYKNEDIDEVYMKRIVLPFIISISEPTDAYPLSIILNDKFLLSSFSNLVASGSSHETNELVRVIISGLDISIVTNIIKDIEDNSDRKEAINLVMKWINIDNNISKQDQIEMISLLIDTNYSYFIESEQNLLIECFLIIRDALIADNRLDEATLLVSSVWNVFNEEKILFGFDTQIYNILIDMILKGEESKNIVHSILENPRWLIKRKNGVILFLYLCHLGNFTDLVEQTKYQYYKEFENTKKNCPVLIDEFFFNIRFTEELLKKNKDQGSEGDVILAIQATEAFEHGLKKVSCYKSWVSASLYQNIFNKRLIDIKDKIFDKDTVNSKKIKETLETINPEKWIQRADKELKNQVKHPAKELMEKYITEQVSMLIILIDAKNKYDLNKLRAYLELQDKTLKERMLDEIKRIESPENIIEDIYRKIAETLK